MVKIIQKIVPASKYSIKCPYSMTPTGIIVCNDDEGFISKADFDALVVE